MTGTPLGTESNSATLERPRRRRRPRPLRPRDQVFGQQAPGNSFMHRAPAGIKLAGLAGALITVMMLREPTVSLAVILLTVILAAASGIRVRVLLNLLKRVWILLVAILAAQLAFNDLLTGAEVMSRVLAGLLAAHLMILTTSTQELLSVLRVLLGPLRLVGIRPGRIVLAALVMLRAIPYLADQFSLAGQQARARGLERNLRARVVPVLLVAMVYARDTGRALCARGIEDID